MANKVATFHKVSFESTDFSKDVYDAIKLPVRATRKSCGYDFFSPFTFSLDPSEEIVIPTGLKAEIADDWFLMCVPKSGLGFKYYVRFANTVGIIDGDYYNNDKNEGHIMIKIRNEGEYPMTINEGKAFCQGIFLPYGVTTDDSAEGERHGGFGSTNV